MKVATLDTRSFDVVWRRQDFLTGLGRQRCHSPLVILNHYCDVFLSNCRDKAVCSFED